MECLICGGTYSADQRRRHEATNKHQIAAGVKHVDKEVQKGDTEVRRISDPEPTPEQIAAVEANVAALNAEAAQTSSETPAPEVSTPAPTPLFPAEAADLAALEKQVKARTADVRWSEKHTDTDSAEKLAKRRARLAEAEAALAAAKG